MSDSPVHPAALTPDELLRACSRETTRRSGPGGQHRNKVETAVVLTHQPTGIRAEASERRSQAENQAMAVFRLRLELANHFRTEVEPATEPSPLWQSRTVNGKLSVSSEHDDFPALLAEALDRVSALQFELGAAAEQLRVSTTQLNRFLQQSPEAWKWVNDERRLRNLRPLR